MTLTRFCAPLAKLLLMVAVVGLMAIVACVSFQVFGRYIMNDTPTWAEALALVLVIWVTMFGAAVGVRDAGHIGDGLQYPDVVYPGGAQPRAGGDCRRLDPAVFHRAHRCDIPWHRSGA